MNVKMKKIFIILAGSALLASGCKKGFLDINTNPNSATEGSITPDLVITTALNNTANRHAATYAFLNRWMGQWAPSGSFSANSEESTYNITSNFATGIWSGIYDNLYDYNFVETKAKAKGQTYYEAIAKVMKAVCFHELVDCYGNVPYSKAFDVSGNIRPAYDNGQAVYNDIFAQLEAARVAIVAADPNANTQIATRDIMFGGNKTRWRQFINTLKLRLLLRQSQIPGFTPTAVNGRNVINEITTDGSGYLTADAEVNPGYLTDKANPFWANFGYTTVGVVANKFNYANPFVLDLMKNMNGGAGGATSDIRYQYFFKRANNTLALAPAPGHWTGAPYGQPPLTPFSYDKVSNIGGIANDASENIIPTAAQTGLCKKYNQGQWIITGVESMFLQAEAIQRGWITGNAQTMYENAVKASHTWLNVPSAATVATAYLASADTKVNFTAAPNKINVILLQKYIALCGISPLEVWSDWRRVSGYINIPLSVAPGRTANTQPVRILYPAVEYNTNADNVQAQGTISPLTSTVFWDR
jgi:hypothetical protein